MDKQATGQALDLDHLHRELVQTTAALYVHETSSWFSYRIAERIALLGKPVADVTLGELAAFMEEERAAVDRQVA
ncbi:hypothetical protein [Methylogaea oryzae]|uniref:Uncharacterized protein n=1 Tax=Methylogaea oryzae TaxID=1295382 RepID=A0A8D4VV31_9GAMM|nr:hypothetical protein [Methylogaea oryzae]BBL72790.1 hypothetical protein MoryE10_33960 [Methylogaea oryzae]